PRPARNQAGTGRTRTTSPARQARVGRGAGLSGEVGRRSGRGRDRRLGLARQETHPPAPVPRGRRFLPQELLGAPACQGQPMAGCLCLSPGLVENDAEKLRADVGSLPTGDGYEGSRLEDGVEVTPEVTETRRVGLDPQAPGEADGKIGR